LYSLYLHLQFKEFDLLLTGDGDSQVQRLLVDEGLWERLPRSVEVLKVPHHGSATGMIEQFVERVKPKISVIQVGKNSYGHPGDEIIKSLSNYGAVYRNDLNGVVEVISDGFSMNIKVQK
jgi:competence protein ComEC